MLRGLFKFVHLLFPIHSQQILHYFTLFSWNQIYPYWRFLGSIVSSRVRWEQQHEDCWCGQLCVRQAETCHCKTSASRALNGFTGGFESHLLGIMGVCFTGCRCDVHDWTVWGLLLLSRLCICWRNTEYTMHVLNRLGCSPGSHLSCNFKSKYHVFQNARQDTSLLCPGNNQQPARRHKQGKSEIQPVWCGKDGHKIHRSAYFKQRCVQTLGL